MQAKYVFINEAQFFKGLKYWTIFLIDIMKKNVILCGLDLDFRREKFGELMDLVPRATSVYRLTGKCNTEGCPHVSLFSHRVVNNNDQVLIGSKEYIPLCENCYDKSNDENFVISHANLC